MEILQLFWSGSGRANLFVSFLDHKVRWRPKSKRQCTLEEEGEEEEEKQYLWLTKTHLQLAAVLHKCIYK